MLLDDVCTHGRVPCPKAALPHGSRHDSYRGCRRRHYAVTVRRAAALRMELVRLRERTSGTSRSTCAGRVAVATEPAANGSRLGKLVGALVRSPRERTMGITV